MGGNRRLRFLETLESSLIASSVEVNFMHCFTFNWKYTKYFKLCALYTPIKGFPLYKLLPAPFKQNEALTD